MAQWTLSPNCFTNLRTDEAATDTRILMMGLLADGLNLGLTRMAVVCVRCRPRPPGRLTARAHTADSRGGTQFPGALVADTLADLRAVMPAGLTRRDRAPIHPAETIEMWD